MKINIKYLIFHMTILIIPLFTLSCFFPFSLGNKIIFGIIIISYVYLNKLLKKKNKKYEFLCFNLILIIYIIYMFLIKQYDAIFNVYFYSYILLFTFSLLFTFENIIDEYKFFFLKHKFEFVLSVNLFILLIIISVLDGSGYRYSVVDQSWTLFGPFQVQHMLAYILLIIYCGCSIYDKENSSIYFLLIKVLTIVMTIFTGVRSSALALCLLIMYDYITMKNKSRKKGIFFLSLIILLLINYKTDFLINNSLINKTVTAIDRGSITNGREMYREVQLHAFLCKSNVIQKLFGVSIPGVTEYMYQALRVHIQAHNDYINTLVGYGIVGFILFILNQLNLSKVCNNFFSKIFLNIFVFILAYYNGFTLYIMLTITLPILISFFNVKTI